MKKLMTSIALLSISSFAMADQSPRNIVERPLTLLDSELQVSGALVYGEEHNGDDDWQLAPQIAYGITDNLSVSLAEIRYRFLAREGNKEGLELATSISYAGNLDVIGDDDDINAGQLSLIGKYVFSPNTAVTFSTSYVEWEEEKDLGLDKSEIRYSVGLQQNLARNLTFLANYEYRDLDDFIKNSANSGSVGLNYAFTKTTDLGIFAAYSDFDPLENGYASGDMLEKAVGAYMSVRF